MWGENLNQFAAFTFRSFTNKSKQEADLHLKTLWCEETPKCLGITFW